MFIIKKHRTEDSQILAISDEYLLDRKIVDGEKILDLTSDFYKGEQKSGKEIINMLKENTHINAVGNKIVSFLEENKIIDKHSEIAGVKYAQAIVMLS